MPPETVDALTITKDPPPAGATPIRSLKAVDGEGCGIFGTLGTAAGAQEKLRAQAKAAGADYVQITSVKEPYADRDCAHKEYTIVGTAFRVHAEPPAASPSSSAGVVPSSALVAAAPQPQNGLLLSQSGCGFRSPLPSGSLRFSARLVSGPGFEAWIDEAKVEGAASGLKLHYDRASRRLELVRYPGETRVSVAQEPFDLDGAWHEWWVVRVADRVSVLLDNKPVLVHVTALTGTEVGFRLEGPQLEIRRLEVTSSTD